MFGNYACNVSTCPEHETTAKGTVLAGGESLLFLSSMVVEPPAIDVRKSVGVVSPCMCNNRSITLIPTIFEETHDQIIRLPSDQQMSPPPFSIQFTTSLEPAPSEINNSHNHHDFIICHLPSQDHDGPAWLGMHNFTTKSRPTHHSLIFHNVGMSIYLRSSQREIHGDFRQFLLRITYITVDCLVQNSMPCWDCKYIILQ